MLRLGAHESIAKGLHLAFERGEQAGCDTVQIWVKNSRQWNAPPLTQTGVQLFKAAREATGIHPVVAHAAYLINLASPKPALRQKSINALIDEVQRCATLDVAYLVLHPGAHTGDGEKQGIKHIIDSLDRVHTATPGLRTQILLETMAGQGSQLGYRFEQLTEILNGVQENGRLGICLDTCHVFAAGYPIHTPEGYKQTLAEFDELIGIERLKALHLNDSQYPLGSRRDRHAHIGKGLLGLSAFRYILNDERLEGRPGLLETPKSNDLHEDRENLATLRGLIPTESPYR